MAFIASDRLPMSLRPKPTLRTRPIFRKQPPQSALISGASKARLQRISRQSFAIFNLFRSEPQQEGSISSGALSSAGDRSLTEIRATNATRRTILHSWRERYSGHCLQFSGCWLIFCFHFGGLVRPLFRFCSSPGGWPTAASGSKKRGSTRGRQSRHVVALWVDRFVGTEQAACLRGPVSAERLFGDPICPVGGRSTGQQWRLSFYRIEEVLDDGIVQIGMRGQTFTATRPHQVRAIQRGHLD